ncbi:macrosialin [Pagrus major]|uniref:macrosialin n=1 Tax=Pagrus major TaxID=143350 RepID=UPI003CC8477E
MNTMKRTALLLFVAVCALSALSLAEDKAKPSATMSPAEEFDPKTEKPPTTTTHAPNTTTHAPNTTTHAPNTTTHAPNTTTHAPNTTTHAPNTTTHAPNTTTSKSTTTPKPPITTPAPTAHPNMTVGNYTLMANKTVICLMAQMALQIRLAKPKANGTFIVQPKNTKTEGYCKEPTANLTLTFPEGHITFMFNKSTEDNTVYVNALSFNILAKGGNGQYMAKNDSVHLFAAKIGNSYSCKNESIFMGDGLYLDVSQDQMQAFSLTESNKFGRPDRCAADQPDYRVAIAVGVVLLVLIIIVVVVYLLGRRRRTDGYQSL